jgi:hypothetical protein
MIIPTGNQDMLLKDAESMTGGLSTPSKMPGYGYNLPPENCKTGAKLRKKKGTVCSKCYACKGRYSFPQCKAAMKRRLRLTKDPAWIQGMVYMINLRRAQGNKHFRWHDSGDVQNVTHLKKIFVVCEMTPDVKHWLPTKEHKIVARTLQKTGKPDNLVIRLSGHYLDEWPYTEMPVSSVHTNEKEMRKAGAKICMAVKKNKPCGNCRACWDPNVQHVSYGEH